MKRLLLLALVAICATGYVFQGRWIPLLAPYMPAPFQAWIIPANPTAQSTNSAAQDKGEKQKQSGSATDSGGKPAQGGRRGGGGGPPTVLVTQAKSGSLPILRQALGTVIPYANTSLASQTPGVVLTIHVKDGAEVKAGDLLFSLDDRAIQALIEKDKAVLARDEALLADANRKLANVQKLVASGVYNQQQGDDAQAAARTAEAAVVVDKAVIAADNVTLSNTKIKAPFDGRIGAILVSRGAFVSAGTPLATITEMAPVFAEFTMSETDLELARSAMASNTLSVSVTPMMTNTTSEISTGPVVFIDSTIDPSSGTFKLRAELANEKTQLWPGQALRVEVRAGDVNNLVIIPVVALIQTADGAAVNVVKPDNTIEIRKIAAAIKVGDQVGVKDGLSDGEHVVIEGQLSLANGATVKIADPNAPPASNGASDEPSASGQGRPGKPAGSGAGAAP